LCDPCPLRCHTLPLLLALVPSVAADAIARCNLSCLPLFSLVPCPSDGGMDLSPPPKSYALHLPLLGPPRHSVRAVILLWMFIWLELVTFVECSV
jgi:hypothetical protein